jgi:Zn-dependent peptidase ImmA (M78 family)
MRRGFKAEAERIALNVRERLGLDPKAPVDPWIYANTLGVVVLDFESLGLPSEHRRQLLEIDPESWSGLTLKDGGKYFVVLNPADPKSRQCNTMMHELAHIHLKHVPKRVDISASGLMLLSDYPADQEDEADWLAAAVLLPRDALHHYKSLGWTTPQICEAFNVSTQLCDWRLRMTGVNAQLHRRRPA